MAGQDVHPSRAAPARRRAGGGSVGQLAIILVVLLILLLCLVGVVMLFCAIWTSGQTVSEKYFLTASAIGILFWLGVGAIATAGGP